MILLFSIISLGANTCSVVNLFLRYAASDMGITESKLKLILYIIQTANIFLRPDKRITGQRFDVGPFGFPGFCSTLVFSFLHFKKFKIQSMGSLFRLFMVRKRLIYIPKMTLSSLLT